MIRTPTDPTPLEQQLDAIGRAIRLRRPEALASQVRDAVRAVAGECLQAGPIDTHQLVMLQRRVLARLQAQDDEILTPIAVSAPSSSPRRRGTDGSTRSTGPSLTRH
jgi:hypothetical protein